MSFLRPVDRWLVWVLSVATVTPLNNDLYVASLPAIGETFGAQNTQLVMSVSLLGLALSQLFCGPLSDRFGRKPVLLTGLTIFIISSFGITIAPSFNLFLIGRFIQAIGACSTLVSALAIARDHYDESALVETISWLMMLIAIVPCLAPIFGSGLQYLLGWQASFAVMGTIALAYFVLITFKFTESLKQKRLDALSFRPLLVSYVRLLRHPHYLGYVLTNGMSYSAMFSMIVVSPTLLIEKLQMGYTGFSMVIGLCASLLILLSMLLPRLHNRFGLPQVLLGGAVVVLIATTLMFAGCSIAGLAKTTIIPAMILLFSGCGVIRAAGSSGAMGIVHPSLAGAAAAMFGFISFGAGALSTACAGAALHLGILPFASLMFLIGIGCVTSAILCRVTLQQNS